jgi:hypothetical protein
MAMNTVASPPMAGRGVCWVSCSVLFCFRKHLYITHVPFFWHLLGGKHGLHTRNLQQRFPRRACLYCVSGVHVFHVIAAGALRLLYCIVDFPVHRFWVVTETFQG